jgi:hypothetical protein
MIKIKQANQVEEMKEKTHSKEQTVENKEILHI